MSKIAIIGEFLEFLKVRKKWWLTPNCCDVTFAGSVNRSNRRFSNCTVYLYAVLIAVIKNKIL